MEKVRHAIKEAFYFIIFLLLLPPLLVIAWTDWGIRQGYKFMRPQNLKARHRERPSRPPVPISRRRALTLPLPLVNTHKHHGPFTNAQEQSVFFKLPLELREMVYQEVLISPFRLHVRRTHRRLCSKPCNELKEGPWTFSTRFSHGYCQLPPMARDGSVQRRSHKDPPRRDKFLPLLSSCRRVYSESVALLYTMNMLLLEDHRTFLLLPKAIAPHRLRSLRFLSLQMNVFRGDTIDCDIQSSWLEICTTLAGMDRLEDLRIALGAHTQEANTPMPHRPVLTLLTPLREVRATRFRVLIPPGCRLNQTIGGDEQPFSVEVRASLYDNCRCCQAIRSPSSFPFPPSWSDM